MEILESESKGIRASGYVLDNNKFIVIRGSFAVGENDLHESFYERQRRVNIRNSLIADSKLKMIGGKYQFDDDVEFNSPSEAASIIWGSMLNGKKVFGIGDEISNDHILYYEIESEKAIEGYKLDRKIAVTQRDRTLIQARKAKDNFTCQICGFSLIMNGKHIIECHHLNPLALGKRETTINELISLCPTCHRIIHLRHPIYSPSEVKVILKIRTNY